MCFFFHVQTHDNLPWSKYSQTTDHASKKLLKSYVELKEFYVFFLFCFAESYRYRSNISLKDGEMVFCYKKKLATWFLLGM